MTCPGCRKPRVGVDRSARLRIACVTAPHFVDRDCSRARRHPGTTPRDDNRWLTRDLLVLGRAVDGLDGKGWMLSGGVWPRRREVVPPGAGGLRPPGPRPAPGEGYQEGVER